LDIKKQPNNIAVVNWTWCNGIL